MLLEGLKKPIAGRVLGIDASTHSIAFCVFNETEPIKYGEIKFQGTDVYERIIDARKKIKALIDVFDADLVAIEAAVMVRSANTGLKMAYIFGAIIAEIIEDGKRVVEVHPITWQSFIGNKNFTKKEKDQVRIDFPGKSETWYKNKIRELRKQKTIDFFISKNINTTSDNVADAAGVAWYVVNNMGQYR